jgi:hypothetical protein
MVEIGRRPVLQPITEVLVPRWSLPLVGLGGCAGVSFFLVSEDTAFLAIKVGTVNKHKKMSQVAHFG